MARLSLNLPDTLHHRLSLQQQAAFVGLREKLGSASDEEIWQILEEREPAPLEAEVGWTPELRRTLEERIEAARKSIPRP